ncbi:hypothetical protein CRENBAI_008946 [Crenichthys baileyi]|uniref:Uncharacterized protein n=1 Tax=Crenichthys baileyi TaxID=28760 RepID=A0AAV9R8I9_9TELE
MDRWRENPRIIADHKEGKTSSVTSHLHGAAANTHAVKYITKPDRKFTPEIQSKDSAKTPKKKRKPSEDVGERLSGGPGGGCSDLSGSVYKPGRTARSDCGQQVPVKSETRRHWWTNKNEQAGGGES